LSAHISAVLRQQVRQRFSNCCAYCQTAERLTAATFEIEHIIPRSEGGETVFANLCLSCPTCNRCKADRIVATDAETSTQVRLFQPHLNAWTDHFAWNDEATEIVALTGTGRATISALRMNRPQLIRLRGMWVAMGEHPPEIE
jgi:hypothetical protein